MYDFLATKINETYVGDSNYDGTTEPNAAADPEYRGLWGDNTIHTMNSQSTEMGIPGFQLESPATVRKQIRDDTDVLTKWAQIIIDLYDTEVVPSWDQFKTPLVFNQTLADMIIDEPYVAPIIITWESIDECETVECFEYFRPDDKAPGCISMGECIQNIS
jgi:hypothetical protein